MKKIPVLFILILIIFSGCNRNKTAPDNARISGRVELSPGAYITYAIGSALDSVKIRKNGTFRFSLPLNGPGTVMLFFKKTMTDIYAAPGKELIINIDPATFPEKISYSGELGPINHYLSLSRKLENNTAVQVRGMFALEPDRFLEVSDSIKDLKLQLIDEYTARYKGTDTAFVSRTREDILFAWADQYLQYPGRYYQAMGRYPDIGPNYHFDYVKVLGLDRPGNLVSQVYRQLLENYIDYRTEVYLAENPRTASLWFPQSIARFRVVTIDFKTEEIRNWLLFRAMQDHLVSYGADHSESFLTNFKINCRNEQYLKDIETLLSKLDKISKGKPAPDFSAYTTDGRKVMLSEYFGQLLYIGFWSTWSDLSLGEIPYFEDLRKSFEGKPVRFILVSLDFEKDKNLWAATIEKNKIGGIQLMQDSKSTVLQNEYYMNEFPRYFLISPEGTIISAFAPRPVENIRLTLDKLLEQKN